MDTKWIQALSFVVSIKIYINVHYEIYSCHYAYVFHSLNSLHFTVGCAPGYYGNVLVNQLTDLGNGQFIEEQIPQCLECPIGMYQNDKGEAECKQCPDYYSTTDIGASSLEECTGIYK